MPNIVETQEQNVKLDSNESNPWAEVFPKIEGFEREIQPISKMHDDKITMITAVYKRDNQPAQYIYLKQDPNIRHNQQFREKVPAQASMRIFEKINGYKVFQFYSLCGNDPHPSSSVVIILGKDMLLSASGREVEIAAKSLNFSDVKKTTKDELKSLK